MRIPSRCLCCTSSSNATFVILPPESVKFLPRMTQVDLNIAKVFNILNWCYDVRFEIFNALNNGVERTHSGSRGTSAGLQTSVLQARGLAPRRAGLPLRRDRAVLASELL